MVASFMVGALGTLIGCVVAFLFSARIGLLAPDSAACASSLYCATYVGGTANFFGVASAINAKQLDALLPSLLAADLGLMGLYLLVLTAASKSSPLQRAFPHDVEPRALRPALNGNQEQIDHQQPVNRALGLAAVVVAAALSCRMCMLLEHTVGIPGISTIALSLGSAAASRAMWSQKPEASVLLKQLAAPSMFLCCVFLGGMGASAQFSQVRLAVKARSD